MFRILFEVVFFLVQFPDLSCFASTRPMYNAVLKGREALARNQNCSYDIIYDIPNTNCCNNLAVTGGFSITHSRGTCINGTCICNDGYFGASDWVNFDGLNCQWGAVYLMNIWSSKLFAYFLQVLHSCNLCGFSCGLGARARRRTRAYAHS